MRKIAYIEIDTHAEIAENFWELTKDSQKLSVDFYFSQRILDLLGFNPSENIFLTNAENLLDKLKNKNYDLVIIGTAHRYFNVFQSVTEIFHTTIIAHNLNFINATLWDLFKNIFKKDTKFRLKLLLKEGLLSKDKVYQNARIHWVLDKNLVVNEEIGIREKNKFLPLFFTKNTKNPINQIFTITISGAVSQKRRDYFSVIERLKNLQITKKLKVIFLGKAQGEELSWLQNLEQENSQNIEIEYFTEKISQNIFDKKIQNSDLLWCPIQEKTEFFGITEFYGKSKMSGNIGDAIKYGKMAILPKNYLEKHPFAISEEEFFEQFSLSKTEKIFENYRKEKILLDLEKIILNSLEI